jgi:hypothetical protein
MIAEARHAGHADSTRDLPIGLPGLVICNSCAAKQLRRRGKHTIRNGGLWLARKSMANGAMLFVDSSTFEKTLFIFGDRRLKMGLLVEISVLGYVSELMFERHFGRLGRNRGMPTGKIRIDAKEYKQNAQQNSQEDALQHSVLSPVEMDHSHAQV